MFLLGSNIDPRPHLATAARELDRYFQLGNASAAYASDPVGAPDSPPFLNAALVATAGPDLHPYAWKHAILRPIESRLGRFRTGCRNEPRTIDIDIALLGQRVLDVGTHGLAVPDPAVLEQAYAALPVGEVLPDYPHPVDGRRLGEIAATFMDAPGVKRLGEMWCAVPTVGAGAARTLG